MTVPISREALLYSEILGIPKEECPPDHYRLLDLPKFEPNPATIQKAITDRLMWVRQGNHGKYGLAMENEIQRVGNLLLNPDLKLAYDGILVQASQQAAPLPPPSPWQPTPQPYPQPPYPYGPTQPNHYGQPASTSPYYPPMPPAPQSPASPAYPYPHGTTQPVQPPAETFPSAAPPAASYPVGASTLPSSSSPGKKTNTPSIKKRSLSKKVPLWMRLLFVGVVIASHGAIYWYFIKVYESRKEMAARSNDSTPVVPEAKRPAPKPSPASNSPVPPTEEAPTADTNEQLSLDDSTQSMDLTDLSTATPVNGVSLPATPAMQSSALSADDGPLEVEAVSYGPLDPLVPEIQLPSFSQVTSSEEGAVVVGSVDLEAIPNLELDVDSSATALGVGQRYAIKPSSGMNDGQRKWDVVLSQDAGSTPEDRVVAHFSLGITGELLFHWNLLASVNDTQQLQNGVLVCRCDQFVRPISLRKASQLSAIDLFLDGPEIEGDLVVTSPPRIESICIEVALKNIDMPVDSEPPASFCSLGDPIFLRAGEKNSNTKAELRVLCRHVADSSLRLSVFPKYRKLEDGKLETLTGPEVVEQVGRLQRSLGKNAEDLSAAYTNLPGHIDAFNKVSKSTPRNKEDAGAKARTMIQLTAQINKCKSTITANTKRMPDSYTALNQIIEAAKIGRALDAHGFVHYRIFASTPSGRVNLIDGTKQSSRPAKTQAFDFLDNSPGIAGLWFTLLPELQIVELSSGGSVTTKDASGKRVLRSGSWSQSGNTVSLTLGGQREEFSVHNDIGMVTSDGKALYRKF